MTPRPLRSDEPIDALVPRLLEPHGLESEPPPPESGVRLSPRAVAAQTPHAPATGHSSRLTRESFLAGDWTIADLDRNGIELRVLLLGKGVPYSEREGAVLAAMARGAGDRAIAESFQITRQCVSGHLSSALTKVGAPSRFAVLQVLRILEEVEKGRTGRARVAEVPVGGHAYVSLRVPVDPRPEVELRLSPAEAHVAWLVCDGLSNREIADARGSSERTVANQVAAIFQKLGVTRRSEVALFLLGLPAADLD